MGKRISEIDRGCKPSSFEKECELPAAYCTGPFVCTAQPVDSRGCYLQKLGESSTSAGWRKFVDVAFTSDRRDYDGAFEGGLGEDIFSNGGVVLIKEVIEKTIMLH